MKILLKIFLKIFVSYILSVLCILFRTRRSRIIKLGIYRELWEYIVKNDKVSKIRIIYFVMFLINNRILQKFSHNAKNIFIWTQSWRVDHRSVGRTGFSHCSDDADHTPSTIYTPQYIPEYILQYCDEKMMKIWLWNSWSTSMLVILIANSQSVYILNFVIQLMFTTIFSIVSNTLIPS